MKIIIALTTIIICNTSFAQKADTSSCLCSYTFSISYPKKANENKISGTVIIEFERDSLCIYSNPRVIQSLGYGCDEEAMKAANQMINSSRKCALKCQGKCKADKIKQPFSFKYVEEK